jgi:DNA-directed RNA polymerase I, II, and III subunit RPABC2
MENKKSSKVSNNTIVKNRDEDNVDDDDVNDDDNSDESDESDADDVDNDNEEDIDDVISEESIHSELNDESDIEDNVGTPDISDNDENDDNDMLNNNTTKNDYNIYDEDMDNKMEEEIYFDENENIDGSTIKITNDYLQKITEKDKNNIISHYYPELISKTYCEILNLCTVVRDINNIIIDKNHQTLPFITKYERARIIGERAIQLNDGAVAMIPVNADMIDGLYIANEEFIQKKIPFIIKRPLPNGICEYWKLSDLEIL